MIINSVKAEEYANDLRYYAKAPSTAPAWLLRDLMNNAASIIELDEDGTYTEDDQGNWSRIS